MISRKRTATTGSIHSKWEEIDAVLETLFSYLVFFCIRIFEVFNSVLSYTNIFFYTELKLRYDSFFLRVKK